jgi:hypothetical protein
VSLLALASGLAGQVPQFRALPRQPLPSTAADAPFKLAVGDFNGDGLPDVTFANMGSATPGLQERLFLSDGRGGYTDTTATHLPSILNWTGGVAVGDFDKDNDVDLFFGNMTGQICCLYFNDGTGKFTDVSATNLPSAGMLGKTVYACAASDIDFDGDLDLIVRDSIWLNNGSGSFTDVTLTNAPGLLPFSPWGMAVGDVNGDAFPDIIYGGLSNQPVLWLNQFNAKFAVGAANFPAMSIGVRGSIGLGDVDGDGDRDLLFPNFQAQPTLWLNGGTGVFTDATATNLPAAVYASYGLALGDLDGNGSLDCVFANITGGTSAAQSNVWLNSGTGVFSDATATRFPVVGHKSVSIAIADMDLDGTTTSCSATGSRRARSGSTITARPTRTMRRRSGCLISSTCMRSRAT